MTSRSRVLLVDMPFASLEAPSPALSYLKARLRQAGADCDVAYLNFPFADLLTAAGYDRIADNMPSGSLAGEWVFSALMFGDREEADETYFRCVLGRLPAAEHALLRRARETAPRFLSTVLQTTSWGSYDIVGFTSSCDQNLASLALAREVKQRHPHVVIIFGGSNWEAEMGVAQLRLFPFVDVAFLGEGDDSLPSLVERLSTAPPGDTTWLHDVPGIAFPEREQVRVTATPPPVDRLDRLPYPDYSDYFDALSRSLGTRAASDIHLWMQASRGCSWAARRPCRFCGLNGRSRAYRVKSPGRILGEIRDISRRWPGCQINLTDTVVPAGFLNDVLPELAADPPGVPLWFEVRPELDREQVTTIAAAGGEIQIGIESLSDHVLCEMAKGSRVLECLRLLKWCRAVGVRHCWNIIFGIPGETDADYAEMVRLVPALRSLQPPTMCGPMFLDRFSTYQERASEYCIEGVGPPQAYACVYPFAADELMDIAYTFSYAKTEGLSRSAHVHRLCTEVRAWKEGAGLADVRWERQGAGATIVCKVDGAEQCVFSLDELDAALYAACEDIGAKAELVDVARSLLCLVAREEVEALVSARLERFIDQGVMVGVGERYLSLALPGQPEDARVS